VRQEDGEFQASLEDHSKTIPKKTPTNPRNFRRGMKHSILMFKLSDMRREYMAYKVLQGKWAAEVWTGLHTYKEPCI
jgi:hypothetical protein